MNDELEHLENWDDWLALTAAAAAIVRAVDDEGPHPHEHRRIMRAHRRQWPTLWHEIDALLEVTP